MKSVMIIASAMWAGTAFAQTSTTNCAATMGGMQCTTQQQPGMDPRLMVSPNPGQTFTDAFQRGMRERQARELAEHQARAADEAAQAAAAQTSALQAQQNAEELHKAQSLEAAKIVSAGDCAGGQQYALSVGNFTLAQQIRDYCGK